MQFSFANDGAFYASGNTLIPMKETVIRLKKEVLDLTKGDDGFMHVNIYFEFFNPGEEKELIVGFVTPPATGDVTDEEIAHPQIKDFFVMVNNQLLGYKVTKMDSTGFKLSDKLAEGDDYVYYFTVRFKKGITVIRHSYAYRGGISTESRYNYDYRLTTATSWAGGSINDFELNIKMGDDYIFAVPFQFTAKPANWEIIGIGRMGNAPRYDSYAPPGDGSSKLKAVYIKKGYLQFTATDFKPQFDIGIIEPAFHNEINWWRENNEQNDFLKLNDLFISDSIPAFLRSLSDTELKMYRNLDYARNGYDFKDASLKKAFMKYFWYIPDPALKTDKIIEKHLDKKTVDLIIAEEKRRKLPN